MTDAETPRCWRSECRQSCYYADVCSERLRTKEVSADD